MLSVLRCGAVLVAAILCIFCLIPTVVCAVFNLLSALGELGWSLGLRTAVKLIKL